MSEANTVSNVEGWYGGNTPATKRPEIGHTHMAPHPINLAKVTRYGDPVPKDSKHSRGYWPMWGVKVHG